MVLCTQQSRLPPPYCLFQSQIGAFGSSLTLRYGKSKFPFIFENNLLLYTLSLGMTNYLTAVFYVLICGHWISESVCDEARPLMGIVVSALTVITKSAIGHYISQSEGPPISRTGCQSHSMIIEFRNQTGCA